MSVETYYLMRRDSPEPDAIPELSVVEMLRETKTDDGLKVPAGSRGTIVLVYEDGKAYEVEFARPVVGLATVPASMLRPA